MKLTNENIETIEVGQRVWMNNGAFRIPQSYVYMGTNSSIGSGRHIYSDEQGQGFSILAGYISYDMHVYTTYEEVCERMRIESLNIIDHYNKHQLKGHPITIAEDDQQYLWRNRKIEQ